MQYGYSYQSGALTTTRIHTISVKQASSNYNKTLTIHITNVSHITNSKIESTTVSVIFALFTTNYIVVFFQMAVLYYVILSIVLHKLISL